MQVTCDLQDIESKQVSKGFLPSHHSLLAQCLVWRNEKDFDLVKGRGLSLLFLQQSNDGQLMNHCLSRASWRRHDQIFVSLENLTTQDGLHCVQFFVLEDAAKFQWQHVGNCDLILLHP